MDNFAPFHEVDDDVWDRVFRINVTALLRLTRAVVPLMLYGGMLIPTAAPRSAGTSSSWYPRFLEEHF